MFGRRTLIALPAIVLCLAACGPTADQVNNSGHEPYANADYEAALDAYQGAQERAPQLGEPHYNSGNVLYRMEEFEEAIQGYDEALRYARSDLRSRGFFNRGNAAFQTQQYAQAVEAYKETLRMNPDDFDAKYNLELALKQLPPQDQDDEQDPPEPEAQPPQAQPPPQSSQAPPPPQDQPPPQESQAEPLTEEQARQALEAVGEDAQTLQERREQTLISSSPQTEFDW